MDLFNSAIKALKDELEEFTKKLYDRLDEITETIVTLNSQQNLITDPTNPSNLGLYYDDTGCTYCATDGSLIFFDGIPRSACGAFFAVSSPLNIVTETFDGASIFCAEIRAVILALETLTFAGYNKVHLVIDSQTCIDLVQTVHDATDEQSIATIIRHNELTADLIRTLDQLLRKFTTIKLSKITSHEDDRFTLHHYLNSRVDFAVTSILREKYANN